jgi:hypothetical protein
MIPTIAPKCALYCIKISHSPNRNALVFGQNVVRVSAGGACVCLCILFDMYQVFFAQNSLLSLGLSVFFWALVLSFVWAFMPFKFAMSMYPALNEMHTASAVCRQELLCDHDHGKQLTDSKAVSVESCLKRVMSHAAAAAVTSGRSSEVYGLVMPVTACLASHVCHCVTLHRSTLRWTSPSSPLT